MAKSGKNPKTGSKAKKPAKKKDDGDDVNTDNGGGRDTVVVPNPKNP
jgi:hypothetical protein